jgi:serine/threonine-protein kinase
MLTAERLQLVEQLFHEALACAPDERAAFLDSSCAGDTDLRSEVESLLAADSASESRDSIVGRLAAGWVSATSTETLIGRDLEGYHIVSLLGAGGMGEVYLADDRSLGRRVALKLLPAAFACDSGRLRRFSDEARAASALNHPNIITVYHIGQFDGGRFIATEFIDGETLRARLGGGPLAGDAALDIAVQVARALHAAHAAAIVHRDIKPENIMIRHDGYVKVLDFGLAKLATDEQLTATEPASSQARLTRAGGVLGTLHYMAPEQAGGRPVDARADLYSLSVVLYEMLTGRLPDAATPPAASTRRLEGLPPDLVGVARRGLAVEPADRYQSADELLRDLERVQQARAAAPARARQRRRTMAAAAIVVSVIAGAGAVVWRELGVPTSESVDRQPAPAPPTARTTTLAVLPFQLIAPGPRDEHLGLGIADAIITQLGTLRRLSVRPTTSIRAFVQPNLDVGAAARALAVDHVLSGLIQRDGDRVRLTVQLINSATGSQEWTARIDAESNDLFALQDTVSQRVAAVLVSDVNDAERARLTAPHTASPEAYQLYLQGRYFLSKATPAAARQSVRLFEQAVALDARYALAYTGLAEAYRQLGSTLFGIVPLREGMNAARAAAARAIELDANLADAHTALGAIQFQYDWDAGAAEASLQRAVALGPEISIAHRFLGWHHLAVGRFTESIEELRRARELDPLSALTSELLAVALDYSGRPDLALSELEAATALEPTSSRAPVRRAWILERTGRTADAVPLWQASSRLRGLGDEADRIGQLFATQGYRPVAELRARAALASRNRLAAVYAYLMLEQTDLALEQMALGIQERNTWVPFLDVDPWFAPLRSDPRFIAIRNQTGWRQP